MEELSYEEHDVFEKECNSQGCSNDDLDKVAPASRVDI